MFFRWRQKREQAQVEKIEQGPIARTRTIGADPIKGEIVALNKNLITPTAREVFSPIFGALPSRPTDLLAEIAQKKKTGGETK
jgi:hypothetical protein